MDVWFYACRLLVGLAILEFFFVLKISSRQPGNMGIFGPKNNAVQSQTMKTPEELSATYDCYAFYIFNAVFIIFCAIYFSVCLLFG